MVTAHDALAELGGVATARELAPRVSRQQLRTAVRHGTVVPLGRGRYAVPTARDAHAAAARIGGVVSHLSAAAYWEWQVLEPPYLPQVCVPRGRKLTGRDRARVVAHWRSLSAPVLEAGVTDRLATLVDCARDLPFHHALGVVDTALRVGDVIPEELTDAGARLRGAGAARVRRVLRAGDGRAANAFESAVRALALEAGLDVVPQVPVRVGSSRVHPDLLDEGRRLVIEADSWTYHSGRSAFRRDVARYDDFVVLGYRVLRFTREDVVGSPRWVYTMLAAAAIGEVPPHLLQKSPVGPIAGLPPELLQ